MRRFFQFRLRTLFVVTTLAAVGVGVAIPVVERYRERQRQIEEAEFRAFMWDLAIIRSQFPLRKPPPLTAPSGSGESALSIDGHPANVSFRKDMVEPINGGLKNLGRVLRSERSPR